MVQITWLSLTIVQGSLSSDPWTSASIISRHLIFIINFAEYGLNLLFAEYGLPSALTADFGSQVVSEMFKKKMWREQYHLNI